MSAERFAQVRKGMIQEKVRALLGTPRRSNVRQFDRGVVAWFYPTGENTGAGVFFHKRSGELAVYSTDFEAVNEKD